MLLNIKKNKAYSEIIKEHMGEEDFKKVAISLIDKHINSKGTINNRIVDLKGLKLLFEIGKMVSEKKAKISGYIYNGSTVNVTMTDGTTRKINISKDYQISNNAKYWGVNNNGFVIFLR